MEGEQVRKFYPRSLKAQANEDTLLWTHCCSWCFLGCANWETFVADTKWFWTKSEAFFVSATNVARAGKRGNICVGNNVSSFARAFSEHNVVTTYPFWSPWLERTSRHESGRLLATAWSSYSSLKSRPKPDEKACTQSGAAIFSHECLPLVEKDAQ